MKAFNHQSGRYISVGDANIYVEEAGTPDGFPIIFLHGGLGSIQDFSSLLDKIIGSYRYIGIDSRGHGKSTSGTQAFSYERLESDVGSILNQLNIRKCAMIGFSDGGIIAYRLAINNPTLIAKLISIGADWNPPDSNLIKLFSSLTADAWEKRFPGTIADYKQLNPQEKFDHLMKNVISMWTDLSPSGYPGNRVKEIECETLIIRGDEDKFMPLNSLLNLHEDLVNSNFLNVPFAGHAAHIDQAGMVSMVINQFLRFAI